MTAIEAQEAIAVAVSVVLLYVGKFLNSAFALSFIGALAGAAAGAWGAQRVIEKAKEREELLREIRSTNAAIMVAFTISNTALGLKKQIVRPMYDRFCEAQHAFQVFREQHQSSQGQATALFKFEADLQGFMAPILPTETLKTLVFDRISAFGEPLSLVSLIENAAVGLVRAIDKRDHLAEELKSNQWDDGKWYLRYFGEKLPSGHTDREFADLVEIIHSYNNDLIFFSSRLCAELGVHGNALSAQFEKKFGKGGPKVSSPDFSGPRKSGLFPPDSDYSSWLGWIVDKQKSDEKSG